MSADSTWTVRVYYEDTDAGGIVYYANYLKFFERARTEWLRGLGLQQHVLKLEHGVIFVVKHASLDYHAPAKLDDAITLTLTIQRLGHASVEFVQHAHRDGILLAVGKIKVACVDALTLRPKGLPAAVAQLMRATDT